MISSRARDGFDHLLVQAIKGSMAGGGVCAVDVMADGDAKPAGSMVMLSASTYLFRLIVLIHFTPDQVTRAYYARGQQIDVDALGDHAFFDALAESGNLCCGILNRELARFFPHIGMSTPNLIAGDCAAYLGALGAGHIRHFRATVEGRPPFQVTLCVCDDADLDFAVDRSDMGSETGELELF